MFDGIHLHQAKATDSIKIKIYKKETFEGKTLRLSSGSACVEKECRDG